MTEIRKQITENRNGDGAVTSKPISNFQFPIFGEGVVS